MPHASDVTLGHHWSYNILNDPKRLGFVLSRYVPKEFVDVLQALVLFFVVVFGPALRSLAQRRAARG